MNQNYCMGITKRKLLCKNIACKNSRFCMYHEPDKGVINKFRYSIPNESIYLPEDIVNHIYKMYFTNHVLKELANYDPQGDFSNIDPKFGINVQSITRDYRLVCDNNLWHFFIRNPYVKNPIEYEKFITHSYHSPRFSLVFKRHYTYNGLGWHKTNLTTFRMNMSTLEYIANNGWFKYIMPD